MRCPACGATNPDGMNFCGKCAAPLGRACPSCGFENPDDFAFCGKCATTLAEPIPTPRSDSSAPPAPIPERAPRDYTPRHLAEKILSSKSALEGERKQVTVLFADQDREEAIQERVPALACSRCWPPASHPLTQEVALGSQLGERRRRTHAAVARAIQSTLGDRLDDELPSSTEVAKHELWACDRLLSNAWRVAMHTDEQEALAARGRLLAEQLRDPVSASAIEGGLARAPTRCSRRAERACSRLASALGATGHAERLAAELRA